MQLIPVTSADRVRALAATIPEDEVPSVLDDLEALLGSGQARVFEVIARGDGFDHWADHGTSLALACLLTGIEHARLLLWPGPHQLALEQVEDAMGRLLVEAFARPSIVAVHTQLDLEAACHCGPLVRVGFVWADDPASARDGTLSLTMTRRTFTTVVPWGKEVSCSS